MLCRYDISYNLVFFSHLILSDRYFFGPFFQQDAGKARYDIEKFVWSSHKPWIPRPLLIMHVRMGDKACEMKVVGFEEYMQLAERIRRTFPELKSIWLSTEMQVL